MTYRERIKGSDQILGEYARLLDGYEIAVEQQQKLLKEAEAASKRLDEANHTVERFETELGRQHEQMKVAVRLAAKEAAGVK